MGSQSKDLLAIDLETGKLRWKYRATDAIGESSPAVADGIVYVGDLAGVLHAVNAADGKALWTFKTEAEIKSSPVVVGDRVLIGSYDGNLYCLSRRDGKLLWKAQTASYVHATPAVSGGIAWVAGCDEVFHGIRFADGQEVLEFPSGGYTGASPVRIGDWAYYGTLANEFIAADVRRKRIVWRYHPSAFPFYSSAAVAGDRIVLGGRDKKVHCLNLKDRQGALDVRHPRPGGFFSGHRRRPRLRRLQRRPFLRAGSGRRQKALGFRSRRAAFRFPAIAAGRIVIGAQDGRIYCFGEGFSA